MLIWTRNAIPSGKCARLSDADYLWPLTKIQFDYNFYLDGTIEVRLSASGYMQGGYWQPEGDGYGGRIRETSSKLDLHLQYILLKLP